MKGTKAKILRAATFLFNTKGVANVSQRDISEHIAISPGNLTYHFKKRDDIIEALYVEIAEAMTDCMSAYEKSDPTFDTFHEFIKSQNKVVFEFRFFMADLSYILGSSKEIAKDYVVLTTKRKALFQEFIDALIANKWMRKEVLDEEYRHLVDRLQLLNDFWVSSIAGTSEEVMLKHTRIAATRLLNAFYPYLTPQGEKLFRASLG